jgi:DNA repair protein RAD51
MTNLYRLEYPGRASLSKKQARISKYMYLLSRIAENSGVAVVITNQVQSNPHPYSIADKLIPVGGNCIASTSRYIISLELMGSTYRNAVLKKESSQAFIIQTNDDT